MKVLGLPELNRAFDRVSEHLAGKAVVALVRRAFEPVLEAAKALVPVDEGELRDSLKLAVRVKKGSGVQVGIRIGKGKGKKGAPPARRWHLIEFGTSNSSPKSFLRAALDRTADKVLEQLRVDLAAELAKVTR